MDRARDYVDGHDFLAGLINLEVELSPAVTPSLAISPPVPLACTGHLKAGGIDNETAGTVARTQGHRALASAHRALVGYRNLKC